MAFKTCRKHGTMIGRGAPSCHKCDSENRVALEAKAALVEELVAALRELLNYSTRGGCPPEEAARKQAVVAIAKAELIMKTGKGQKETECEPL